MHARLVYSHVCAMASHTHGPLPSHFPFIFPSQASLFFLLKKSDLRLYQSKKNVQPSLLAEFSDKSLMIKISHEINFYKEISYLLTIVYKSWHKKVFMTYHFPFLSAWLPAGVGRQPRDVAASIWVWGQSFPFGVCCYFWMMTPAN